MVIQMVENDPQNELSPIEKLIDVMAKLRDRENGCPWDIEQTFETIAPYTIEEAYEVFDAIQAGDQAALKTELGDLLFQVIYYAQMSRENGGYDFDDIANAESQKMISRHPHVFGDAHVPDADAQTLAWEAQKAAERGNSGDKSALSGVAKALPALIRAEKLAKRAARVGFDWENTAQVIEKIHEELAETEAEINSDAPKAKIEGEIGDLLFAVANLARKTGIDPEAALRTTNDKFIRRFAHIEAELKKRGKTPEQSDLAEMDALWNEAKEKEGNR
jgi:nucleoside triphosphate diphosphatase